MIDMIKGVMTRTKETDIEKADRQISALDREIEPIQQKISGIDEQIEQLIHRMEHLEYSEKEAPKILEKARDRLRAAKEQPVDKDATREVERLNYLRTLETNLAKLEQETPNNLETLEKQGDELEARHVTLFTERDELKKRLAELLHDRQVIQMSRNDMHLAAGEALYDQLIQGFNETDQREREASVLFAELKQELARKSEEAQVSLTSWPGLQRRFQEETAHTLRISQGESIDSSAESLKLARARKG